MYTQSQDDRGISYTFDKVVKCAKMVVFRNIGHLSMLMVSEQAYRHMMDIHYLYSQLKSINM